MKQYPTKEGKHGIIYQVAEGVNVTTSVDGTYELSVKHKGERIRKRFGQDLDKALQAAELLATKMGLAAKGTAEVHSYTFGQAAEDWIKVGKGRWSPGTIERYTQIVRDFINPSFERRPIEKMDRTVVKEFLADIFAMRSAKTTELVHAVMSGIFSEAIDRGKLRENPCAGLLKRLLPPKKKRNETVPDPLSKEDLYRVIEAAWKHLPAPKALVIETLAQSGMRLGEGLAMHVDHLDIKNSQYMVSETVKRDRFGLPKNGKRLIDLPEDLTAKLERYVQELRRQALSEGKEVGYLFPGISQSVMRSAMRRACRAAKVRVRTPHDLRHSYATILLMAHMSPAYVQKQVGHSSISITVDIYGHWIPGEGRGDLEMSLAPRKAKGQDRKTAHLEVVG